MDKLSLSDIGTVYISRDYEKDLLLYIPLSGQNLTTLDLKFASDVDHELYNTTSFFVIDKAIENGKSIFTICNLNTSIESPIIGILFSDRFLISPFEYDSTAIAHSVIMGERKGTEKKLIGKRMSIKDFDGYVL